MSTGEEARRLLLAFGRPAAVLWALRAEIGLSDLVLGQLVERSAQTVRRWRKAKGSVEIPDEAAVAIDDLRAIVAMLLKAGFDGPTIKDFLLSRNTGLGQDRPLHGLRVRVGAFHRVQRVTECFIAGIAPQSGSALVEVDDDELEPAVAGPSTPQPSSPASPVGSGV